MRYVGTKGSKLLGGVNLDTDVINSNGILQAFNITRAGGQAPLFDQLFAGLTVAGQGAVNGTTVRGSDYARANSTIAQYLANGNVGAFANFINTTPTGTNVNGGLTDGGRTAGEFHHHQPAIRQRLPGGQQRQLHVSCPAGGIR